MKKLLLLTNEFYPYKGGIGRYCEEMVEQFKKEFDVTVACPSYNGESLKYPRKENISFITFMGGRYRKSRFFLLVAQVMMIDFKKFDYVFVADWPVWLAISFINRYIPFKNIKFSLMLHGSEILSFKHGKLSKQAKRFQVFKNVSNIFTNSDYTKKILMQNFGSEINVTVKTTHLAAKVNKLPKVDITERKNRDRFTFLTVGRLDSRKGHSLVIEALGNLNDSLRKKTLYRIVGNGSQKYIDNLKELARNNSVDIEIAEEISDEYLAQEFLNSDVFVLAARSMPRKIEGFGLVILEAAGYGIPSITTDVGGIPEVVDHEKSGLVCKEDQSSLTEAMNRILIDSDLLDVLSKNAIKHYQSFSWEKTCKMTVEALEGEGN